jgi:tripartite-type tricarboxylate transporter receptor subunit TctC
MRNGVWRLAAALAGVLAWSGVAPAQDYPTKPITLVVPYAAGGGNDVLARLVAEPMAKQLGQQIVIDNRGGAGGSIGTRQVARAAADGYTLVIGGTGSLAVNPTLYDNVGYDPRKDFTPVGMIAAGALVILVHPSVKAHTVKDIIALAKEEPGKVNYASAGIGSGIHLGAELFAHMAGIKLTHVPYKGTGPALNDLLGGHVMMYFSSIPPAARLVKDGKVRAIAVTGTKRSKLFPDVPTVAETVPATRPCCAMASSPRPARRSRSSTSSTPRCAPRSRPRRCRSGWRRWASSRCRARPRITPPTSTARRRSGRRS